LFSYWHYGPLRFLLMGFPMLPGIISITLNSHVYSQICFRHPRPIARDLAPPPPSPPFLPLRRSSVYAVPFLVYSLSCLDCVTFLAFLPFVGRRLFLFLTTKLFPPSPYTNVRITSHPQLFFSQIFKRWMALPTAFPPPPFFSRNGGRRSPRHVPFSLFRSRGR